MTSLVNLQALVTDVSSGVDVQLKVLQTLPSLFQWHAGSLSGQLLATTLEICATLQNVKTTAVANTAAATLQQLVIAVFDKASKEDASLGKETVNISVANYDAFRLFDDLCRLVEGEKLEYLSIKSLSRIFVLELIESILVNNARVFAHHPEHAYVLRYRLMPLTVRFLSERHNFSFTVRVARILLLLLKSHLDLLAAESEVALSLLIHLLDTDASPPWKRAICMEIFKNLYSEPRLIRLIFRLFDEHKERKSIVKDHMACLVRLAAENPSLIGVSHRSTVPVAPESSGGTIEEQVALEAVVSAGLIGSPSSSTDACGISSQWSLLRAPYIETLDKLEAPNPPETYLYSLVLNCISSFSDSIAKFILPLTVTETKNRRKRQESIASKEESTIDKPNVDRSRTSKSYSVPLNPLDFESHPQVEDVKSIAEMIDACWPAVLATSSTFLYAALDNEFYHNLVRAFQRLAHVAGLLRLKTPRDAFLTTLSKAAVPADMLNSSTIATLPSKPEDHLLSAPASPVPKSPSMSELVHPSTENQRATLNTRNLLCLRALLNLGIALGPTLDSMSWSIILETLQHADVIISTSSTSSLKPSHSSQSSDKSSAPNIESLKENFGNEIYAVRAAASKMFENSQDYPNASLKIFLITILSLSDITEAYKWSEIGKAASTSPAPIGQPGRLHPSKRSTSIALSRSRIQENELTFVLQRTGELLKSNTERLSMAVDDEGIWDILVTNLIAIIQNGQINLTHRSKASEVLNALVLDTVKIGESIEPSSRNQIQLRGFHALMAQISGLYGPERRPNSITRAADFQVHEFALETLKSMLEQCGDSITAGWDMVFALISSVFTTQESKHQNTVPLSSTLPTISDPGTVLARSSKLVRTAYDSLQLVASDFLSLLPTSCLLEMVETFSYFTSQTEDFNISLTTTTFFWNISDFLRGQIGNFAISGEIDITSTEESLAKTASCADSAASRNALWLLLLLRIVHTATDSRTEIRNSAIQTLLRILDHYGQQLASESWHICLNRVLLVMAESVGTRLRKALESTETGSPDRKAWVETTVLVTKGLSSLITNFFGTISHYSDFRQSWSRLLQYFGDILKTKLLELDEATFAGFAEVLSSIKNCQDVGKTAIAGAWSVWANNPPTSEGHDPEAPNQEALRAYLNMYSQIYRLLGSDLDSRQIVTVLKNLQLCVWGSITTRYSLDLERQSEVQKTVIECLKALCLDKPNSQSAIVRYLGRLADSSLTRWSPEQGKEKPTFVAFSKATMKLLSWYLTEKGIQVEVLSEDTLSEAIGHLVNPILNKYAWTGEDREPLLWQIATTTSLDILQISIPSIETEYQNLGRETITKFWLPIVELTRGIVSVDDSVENNVPLATLAENEQFDIAAFHRLLTLIVPSLGSSVIPDKIRREFAFILFKSSLVYPPQRTDPPLEDLKLDPLRDLYHVRSGRTVDAFQTPRIKLSYLLIDTLFNLASAHLPKNEADPKVRTESTQSYISIAKSMSPFLVLRCAMALKSYVADQPLRGLMPQPAVSRKELLHLLRKLDELKSEPAAIPATGLNVRVKPSLDETDAGNDEAKYKKHLGWVYPLIVKGVPVAGREGDDRELLEALTKILDSVASYFILGID
ncbi:predicted protein [Uncinocarpus reesii 1704]|uniref:Endosomal peripheral membrane protein n=1 Tax=Uncinocarpus reesii (strain UAMH 1704) TaxID=336963 RepID=C4JSC0_UNCRE|nr:uncharacterized protein UREG_05359 [Uncinocarpus reesii 1704]EEP80517.1 predicted protein [Uncinocarpus reesii 1704]